MVEIGLSFQKIKPDTKTRIVERLVALKKLVDGVFVLDQHQILVMLHNVWGSINPSDTVHHNDRMRIFGIIMSISDNMYMY